MNELAFKLPQEVLDERANLIALTESFQCRTVEDLQVGSRLVEGWKALKKGIQIYFRTPKENAARTHKGICAMENAEIDPIDACLSKVQGESNRFLAEQRRAAEEAERNRVAAERKALAEVEEARRKAEQEARLNAAIETKNEAVAESILQEPVPAVAPAPVAVVAPPKVGSIAGVKTRKVWKSRVTDMAALLDSIAKNETPLSYVQSVTPSRELCALAVSGAIPITAFVLDEKAINSLVTAQKETFRMVGIEAYQEETIF